MAENSTKEVVRATKSEKPDYGIDAPGVVATLGGVGATALVLSLIAPNLHLGTATVRWGVSLLWMGSVMLGESVLMLLYAKAGKFRHRDRMLAKVDWRGDEQVLDVGTGRGVMMIGAAKRLSTGRAVGIDIWSKKDLSGNDSRATLHNAELEGVAGKVEIRTEDASQMSFPDTSFDVVLSNLCLHNIEDRKLRADAVREIARVLKPGGVAIISDFKKTGEYEETLKEMGLQTTRTSPALFDTFPPLRIVIAKKR